MIVKIIIENKIRDYLFPYFNEKYFHQIIKYKVKK